MRARVKNINIAHCIIVLNNRFTKKYLSILPISQIHLYTQDVFDNQSSLSPVGIKLHQKQALKFTTIHERNL